MGSDSISRWFLSVFFEPPVDSPLVCRFSHRLWLQIGVCAVILTRRISQNPSVRIMIRSPSVMICSLSDIQPPVDSLRSGVLVASRGHVVIGGYRDRRTVRLIVEKSTLSLCSRSPGRSSGCDSS
ncbi:hypothetical protein M378DRAFT_373125 [Amanita muscaria Koide BX008]|uniref:Uncharacterized protein n=1 Tax=Amanita muscaria (strain Koide BX008) TaxID=946122 RepID=A0A0C2XBD2_AMAMK|nr:hypothetical protein M378DRAFT_373125 [Amanita muscaria Koide BX008]